MPGVAGLFNIDLSLHILDCFLLDNVLNSYYYDYHDYQLSKV